jgi:tyrosine-protein kinase
LDTSQTLTIRVHASNPEVAANIANALGETLISRSPGGPASLQATRRQAALTEIAKIQETIRATETEIDQLTNQIQQTTDQVSQRALIVRLDQRRAQLTTSQRALTDQYTIVQNGGANQIAVMEQAVPNPVPIAPEVVRNVLAALIAGLVLGLAAMLLFEYFTDVIYTSEELRKATGMTYLGGIARHSRLRGGDLGQIVVHARPETLSAEGYRMLRTNLQMAGSDLHLPSLLVTSAARGDGKTEVATNLAVSLAQGGKTVILVDANLRRPRISALFGLPEEKGLSNLLDQRTQVIEALPIDAIPGLSVLPAGLPVPNSSDILGSPRMQRLIEDLKACADIVIIDSPPLLYSDALALALRVDGVLLVANSGTTGRENMINAVENLRLVGAHLIGTVLNRVKGGPSYSYYPSRVRKSTVLALGSPSAVPAIAAPVDAAQADQPDRSAPNAPAYRADTTDDAAQADQPDRSAPDAPAYRADTTDDAAQPSAEVAGPAPEAGDESMAVQPAPTAGAPTLVLDRTDLVRAEVVASEPMLDDAVAASSAEVVASEPMLDDAVAASSAEVVASEPMLDDAVVASSAEVVASEPALNIAVGTPPRGSSTTTRLVEPEDDLVETGAAPAVYSNGRRGPQDDSQRTRGSRRNRGRS